MFLEYYRLITNTSILELYEETGIPLYELSLIMTGKRIGTKQELGEILFFLRNKSTKCVPVMRE